MIILILLFGLFLRLYRLDLLPGEMWGDAIELYKLANAAKNGNYFFEYRYGSDGPLILL